jgi:hypothetical protein
MISSATSIRAIAYTNENSSEHSSYNDLLLGHIHGNIGCNSKVQTFRIDLTKGQIKTNALAKSLDRPKPGPVIL